MKPVNLSGQKFGKLTVVELIGSKHTHRLYLCLCDCGNHKEATSTDLRRSQVRSCGCLYKNSAIKNAEKRYRGYNDLSLSYWNSLKNSAIKRNLSFNITMEYAWDLFVKQNKKCYFSGEDLNLTRKYSSEEQNASIDRIDNSIGYEEGNIRWTTKEINCLKWNYEDDEFLKICSLIANKNS